MLPTAEIDQRLLEIDGSYQSETDPIKALMWAKLACLEVSGWTEECIDKIVSDYLDLKNPVSKQKVMDKLKNTWGFRYSKEFRSIMVEMIGSILFDQIESRISLECQQLQSALSDLKNSRDVSAHTYTKQNTSIDAPSKMINLLGKISAGLAAFEIELAALQI